MALNIEAGLYIGIGLGVCALTNYEPLADAVESIVSNGRARHFAFAAVMIFWPLWLLYLLLQLLMRRQP